MVPDTPPYNAAATPGSKDALKAMASGFVINFAKRGNATLADVFGSQPLSPVEAVNKMWEYIKKHEMVTRRQS